MNVPTTGSRLPSGEARASEASDVRQFRFEHKARARELLPIVLVNALLNLVTLTIFRFWGKTRVRRYLWSRTRLLGDPFEYTGTGLELFKGFLIVSFCVVLPLVIVNGIASYFLQVAAPLLYVVFAAAFYLVVLFLIGMAIYRARRYRLSRTVWRGIRGAQTGSAARYALKSLGFTLSFILSLGLTYPWQRMRLMHQMMNETWFGDRRFVFEGQARALYKPFLVVWLAYVAALVLGVLAGLYNADMSVADAETILRPDGSENPAAAFKQGMLFLAAFYPILLVVGGLGLAWYKAREYRYLASCVGYEGLRFSFDATFGGIVWLAIGNFLIVTLTLGLGAPFAQMRMIRFFCNRLSAVGQVDFEAIRQSSVRTPRIGEGLADAFDVGGM